MRGREGRSEASKVFISEMIVRFSRLRCLIKVLRLCGPSTHKKISSMKRNQTVGIKLFYSQFSSLSTKQWVSSYLIFNKNNNSASTRSSRHVLRIRMTPYPYNKYDLTASLLIFLSVEPNCDQSS